MKKINQLVSIIVPVYNAETYLNQCIKSILSQTYENIELILINDGSHDKSGLICEKYSAMDKRVTVISQKNQGPSVARNKGIEYSKGDFIQFVDADDKIDRTMIEKLMKANQKDVELVLCGYKTISLTGENITKKVFSSNINGMLTFDEFMYFFSSFFNKKLINSPCNKLYNAKLIKKNKLNFPVDIHNGEDLIFNIEYIKCCKYIYIMKESLYYYNHTNNPLSLTKRYKSDFLNNRKLVFNKVKELILNNHQKVNSANNKLLDQLFINYLLQVLSNLFHDHFELTKKSKKAELRKIVNDDWVQTNIRMSYATTYQDKIIALLLKYKSVVGIILYFNIKSLIRKYFKRLFLILRELN